jgi:C-terminal processing protease CtpA/Prc
MAGILRIGDEVVGVEGMHAAAMTLDQIRERIAGKRGSRVDLTFRRGESDAEFTITFKRGAWGPEHCVVTPENLDMIDKSSGSPSKGVRAA